MSESQMLRLQRLPKQGISSALSSRMHADRRSDVSTVVFLASTFCGITMQTVKTLLYFCRNDSVQTLLTHY
jgi:hypothetical protein